MPYRFGGVGLGIWLTGKLGRAWVDAWVGAWAWCMGLGGLDGDGEEVVGVVSCEMENYKHKSEDFYPT